MRFGQTLALETHPTTCCRRFELRARWIRRPGRHLRLLAAGLWIAHLLVACGPTAPDRRLDPDAAADRNARQEGPATDGGLDLPRDGGPSAQEAPLTTGDAGGMTDAGLSDAPVPDARSARDANASVVDGQAALIDATAAPGFTLALPLRCTVGDDCAIVNYVDLDPGREVLTDYACGRRSYDGHKGTDFAIRDETHMALGVDVLAAAAGTVKAVRDGMPDVNRNDVPPASYAGRECGNGVVLEHGEGWTTQYCHLRRGSLAVAPGEPVARAQRLGEVGLSGNTEFPHLHLQLSRHGEIVDPFSGGSSSGTCGDTSKSLWSAEVFGQLNYRPQLIQYGFAARPLDMAEVFRGDDRVDRLPANAPAIVLYAHFFGIEQGDRVTLKLFGPRGELLQSFEGQPLAKDWVLWTQRLRHERTEASWPRGTYGGLIVLSRNDGTASPAVERSVTLRVD